MGTPLAATKGELERWTQVERRLSGPASSSDHVGARGTVHSRTHGRRRCCRRRPTRHALRPDDDRVRNGSRHDVDRVDDGLGDDHRVHIVETDDTGTETTTTESTTTESTTTESTPAPSGPPTITSDQPDYAPGATVTLMGTNWAAGEAVHLFVNDDKAKTWSYIADITADADGRFMNQFQLPASFVAVYTVTARGPTSGIATTSFTDASLSVAASPTWVTFALTYQGFSDSTCTNPINGSNGQPQPQSVTAGTNFQVTFGSAGYEKLTAGSASAPTGATFSSWTGPSSFNSPNATVCVATPSGERLRLHGHVRDRTDDLAERRFGNRDVRRHGEPLRDAHR